MRAITPVPSTRRIMVFVYAPQVCLGASITLDNQNQLIFLARRSERSVPEIEGASENQLPLNQLVPGSSPGGSPQNQVQIPNGRPSQGRPFWLVDTRLTPIC
jgi:hypothetical protein